MSAKEEKELKQREVMYRVLADTVVNQLVESGCKAGELINFGSEVIRCITDRGFASNPDEEATVSPGSEVRVVRWHVDETGDAWHQVCGPRVMLRPLEPKDRSLLDAWRKDEDVQRTFSKLLIDWLLDHLDGLASQQERRDFLVCDEEGQGIGLVCLFHIDPEVSQAETAKLLAPVARGKGYATEASSLLLTYAFKTLGLRRVYLRTAGFNLHNIKINERIGFKFEGILRESDTLGGRRVDTVLMSMLAREFQQAYRVEDL